MLKSNLEDLRLSGFNLFKTTLITAHNKVNCKTSYVKVITAKQCNE